MINLLISVNSKYLDKAVTMLHSFKRKNDEETTVYLINHSLESEEIKKFRWNIEKCVRMNLEIIKVSDTLFDQLPCTNRFSVEIYYRVIAQFLLPVNVDRILWLDADIIICNSVHEFYHQKFSDYLMVVCPDINDEDEEIRRIKTNLGLPKEHVYFNSGVLLLNVDALRISTDIKKIIQIAQKISPYYVYPDQDLLNYLYCGKVKYCDQLKYNCQVNVFNRLSSEQVKDISILHYAGYKKPWLVYYLRDLSESAVPYWKEVISEGKYFLVMKMMVLYGLWLLYDMSGISSIVRRKKTCR